MLVHYPSPWNNNIVDRQAHFYYYFGFLLRIKWPNYRIVKYSHNMLYRLVASIMSKDKNSQFIQPTHIAHIANTTIDTTTIAVTGVKPTAPTTAIITNILDQCVSLCLINRLSFHTSGFKPNYCLPSLICINLCPFCVLFQRLHLDWPQCELLSLSWVQYQQVYRVYCIHLLAFISWHTLNHDITHCLLHITDTPWWWKKEAAQGRRAVILV